MCPFRKPKSASRMHSRIHSSRNHRAGMSRLEILALFVVVLAVFTVCFSQSIPGWIAAVVAVGSSDFDNAPLQQGLGSIESVTIHREGADTSGVTPAILVRFNGYVYPVPESKDWMRFKPGATVKVNYRQSHTAAIRVESIEPY